MALLGRCLIDPAWTDEVRHGLSGGSLGVNEVPVTDNYWAVSSRKFLLLKLASPSALTGSVPELIPGSRNLLGAHQRAEQP